MEIWGGSIMDSSPAVNQLLVIKEKAKLPD